LIAEDWRATKKIILVLSNLSGAYVCTVCMLYVYICTYLQLLVNLLLDRSTHLRRVDSHYSRARLVRWQHPGVSLRARAAAAVVDVNLGDEARDNHHRWRHRWTSHYRGSHDPGSGLFLATAMAARWPRWPFIALSLREKQPRQVRFEERERDIYIYIYIIYIYIYNNRSIRDEIARLNSRRCTTEREIDIGAFSIFTT